MFPSFFWRLKHIQKRPAMRFQRPAWKANNATTKKEGKVRSRKGIETEGQHRPVVYDPLFN